MSSTGTNNVLNKHEGDDQYGPFAIPSKIMPYQSYPESFVTKWNPYWVIILMNSSSTNSVPNGHEDVEQYDPHTIPSKIILKLSWKFG